MKWDNAPKGNVINLCRFSGVIHKSFTLLRGKIIGTQKQHYSLSRIKARNRKTEILWIFFGIHTANAILMIEKIRNKTVLKAVWVSVGCRILIGVAAG